MATSVRTPTTAGTAAGTTDDGSVTAPRRRTGRHCASCAAACTDRRARFCGRCGAVLAAAAPRQRSSRRPALQRHLVPGTVALVLVGLFAATSVSLSDAAPGGLLGSRDDPEVALPAPGTDPPPPALGTVDPSQAAALRDQVATARLRCEPRGCEVWRRELDEASWTVASGGGRIAIRSRSELAIIDAADGTERQRVDLGGLGSVTGDGDAITGAPADVQVGLIDGGLLLAYQGRVWALPEDGATAWSTSWSFTTGLEQIWVLAPLLGGSRVLLEGLEATGEPGLRLLDTADGSVLWRAVGGSMANLDDTGLIHHSGPLRGDGTGEATLTAIAAADGTPLWTRRVSELSWPLLLGGLLVVSDVTVESGVVGEVTREEAVVVDRATGELVDDLGGRLLNGTQLPDQGVALLLLQYAGNRADPPEPRDPSQPSDPSNPPRADLLVLDPDGTQRWRTQLPALGADCCPDIASLGDGTILVGLTGGLAVRLGAADGQLITEPFARPADVHRWTVENGSATVAYGPGGTLTFTRGDASVRIIGQDPWMLSSDPFVAQGPSGLLGARPVPPSG